MNMNVTLKYFDYGKIHLPHPQPETDAILPACRGRYATRQGTVFRYIYSDVTCATCLKMIERRQ